MKASGLSFFCYNIGMKKLLSRKQVTELEDELLIDIEDKDNDYQRFLEERRALLPEKSEMEHIEQVIRISILEVFKKNKLLSASDDMNVGYFKYQDYFAIDYIKDYFNIIVASGDRNIGKSYSSHEIARDVVSKKKKFMLLRNIDDEVKAQLSSDTLESGWLTGNGWTYKGNSKSPNIVDINESEVGFYRALNTSAKFKSTDFPDTELIIWEEFNAVKIQDGYEKFVKMLSTIMRHNPNGKAILQANYVDQNDGTLQALGIGSKQLTKKDFVVFNWEVGAILINIPKGIYRMVSNKKNDLAYRASLAKYDVWKSQYGGGFSNEEPVNIINEKSFLKVEPVFNIYHAKTDYLSPASTKYSAFKMTLYHVWDENGEQHNVLTQTIGSNDKPIFIFDHVNKIMYPHANLISWTTLESLITHWNSGNLKTIDVKNHAAIVALFAVANKILENETFEITEVENMIE